MSTPKAASALVSCGLGFEVPPGLTAEPSRCGTREAGASAGRRLGCTPGQAQETGQPPGHFSAYLPALLQERASARSVEPRLPTAPLVPLTPEQPRWLVFPASAPRTGVSHSLLREDLHDFPFPLVPAEGHRFLPFLLDSTGTCLTALA